MPSKSNPFKRELSAWRVMRRRCLDPKQADFARYGAMGITVCQPWRESFSQFLADMGPAPTQTHWLGRLDVRGNYEKTNCVWTTQAEQKRRRAFCRKVTLYGQTVTAAEAARFPGMPKRDSVLRRMASGLPLENPPAAKLYRASKWLTHNGTTLPLPQWARMLGIPSSTLWLRINRGTTLELALTPGLMRSARSRQSSGPESTQSTPA
jgi:hypothetical protein